jgi:hypothetical protein
MPSDQLTDRSKSRDRNLQARDAGVAGLLVDGGFHAGLI